MLGALSDVGNRRNLNEDYFSFYEGNNFKVYIIADGMGGHNAGEVASKLAVEKTIEYIKNVNSGENIAGMLRNAVIYANKEVFNFSREKEDLKGMGTTITACITDGNKYIIANVGDSSCYALFNNGFSKVTKDHSLVQQLIDEGSITEEEGRNHPNKNIITRAIGTGENVDVDTFEIDCCEVVKLVLCTDGLTNEVSLSEMHSILLNGSSNKEISKTLVELAKERGGRDNITVMVIQGECDDDRNHIK